MTAQQFTKGDRVRWKIAPYYRPGGGYVTHHTGTFVEYLLTDARVIIHNRLDQPTGAFLRIDPKRLEKV